MSALLTNTKKRPITFRTAPTRSGRRTTNSAVTNGKPVIWKTVKQHSNSLWSGIRKRLTTTHKIRSHRTHSMVQFGHSTTWDARKNSKLLHASLSKRTKTITSSTSLQQRYNSASQTSNGRNLNSTSKPPKNMRNCGNTAIYRSSTSSS